MPLQQGLPYVRKYGAGSFVVGEQNYAHAVLLSRDGVVPVSEMSVKDLQDAHVLEALLAQRDAPMEVLLVGSGERMVMLPAPVRVAMRERGVALDVMDTGAACRTFNVLLQEGRQVAALLFPV